MAGQRDDQGNTEDFGDTERARPTLRGLRARARQGRTAARQLVALLRHAGPALVATTALVHLVAGLLPIVFLVGISFAIEQLATRDGDAALGSAGTWLAVALGAFVVQQALASAQLLLSQAIMRRVDAYCITRFTRFALTRAPLRTLERADVADRLAHANESFEQWTLTPGAATEGALALLARYVQLAGTLVVAAVAVGWPVALAAGSVALVARRGQSAAFYRWGQLIRSFAPARRRTAYLRELGTSTRAAKEIRSLGLVDWMDERFATESRAGLEPLWSWRRRVYGLPFVLYAVLSLAGTAAALVLIATGDAGGGNPAQVVMGVQAVVLSARFGQMFPESDLKMVYGRSAWEALLEFEQLCRQAGTAVPAPRRPTTSGLRPQTCIRFDDVHFAYDPARPMLRGLDLELPVGTSTALVGVNGAGKTTLVKLLTGLYTRRAARCSSTGSTCGPSTRRAGDASSRSPSRTSCATRRPCATTSQ